jgi:hypothetical protein
MKSEALEGPSQSLNTDNLTVKTLRDFLSDESKPTELQPVDLLYLAYLMLRKAEDHGITDSKLTLSQRFNCSPRTIVSSRKRLAKIGYISVERRKGRTSAISINTANVPAEAALRSKLTPEAKSIALHYQNLLRRLGKKKFPKHFLNNQVPSAQRILDNCEGNETLATSVIDYAVRSPVCKNFARKSLYELFSRWEKVKSSFHAANAEVLVPIAVIEPTPPVAIPPARQNAATLPVSPDEEAKVVELLSANDIVVNRRLANFGLKRTSGKFSNSFTMTQLSADEAVRLIAEKMRKTA